MTSVAAMPLINNALASTPWTLSLNRTSILVRLFFTLSKAAGALSTINGATTLVGGIVMTTLDTADVPRSPEALNATACHPLLPNGLLQAMRYGGVATCPILDPFAKKSTFVTPS